MSDELAAEHSIRYGLDNGEGLDVDDVARLLADYERRGTALRFLDEKYNIRREQQQRQDARVTKLSADLARALPVVEAAGELVEGWVRITSGGTVRVDQGRFDALARAVRGEWT